jgi:predicted flap endonuclease-1-like 5' DNA nuclease
MGNEAYIEEMKRKHLKEDPEHVARMQARFRDQRKQMTEKADIRQDGQRIVDALSNENVTIDSDLVKIEGLGDLIHATLNKLGITEERFKQVLQLKECNCSARRKFLNKLIPFTKDRSNGE